MAQPLTGLGTASSSTSIDTEVRTDPVSSIAQNHLPVQADAPAASLIGKITFFLHPRIVWQPIVRFVQRYVFRPKVEDTQAAKNISELTQKTGEALAKAFSASRVMKAAERENEEIIPSEATIEIGAAYLKALRECLQEGKQNLAELSKHKESSHRLSEAHSTFELLPRSIARQERMVHYFEGRLEIGEKLLELERAIQAYAESKNWSEFAEISNKRSSLYAALAQLILENPAFNEDYQISSYKNHSLVPSEAYELILHFFPGLTFQVTRLFKASTQMVEERQAAMKQQATDLHTLFKSYHEASKEFHEMERAFYQKAPMKKAFFGSWSELQKNEKKAKIDEAKKEAEKIALKIQEKAQFDPDEIQWMKEKGFLSDLPQDLEDMQEEVTQLPLKQEVSDKIYQLSNSLKAFRKTKAALAFITENPKDLRVYTSNARRAQRTLLNSFIDLLKTMNQMSRQNFPQSDQSPTLLKQFKLNIKEVFPDLLERAKRLLQLVKELNLSETISKAMEKGEPITGNSTDGTTPFMSHRKILDRSPSIQAPRVTSRGQQKQRVLPEKLPETEQKFDGKLLDEIHQGFNLRKTKNTDRPKVVWTSEELIKAKAERAISEEEFDRLSKIVPLSKQDSVMSGLISGLNIIRRGTRQSDSESSSENSDYDD